MENTRTGNDTVNILEVRNASVMYGSISALDDVSLTIGKGELVTVLGANGAGKTTLLRAISGLVPVGPRTSIVFNGEEVRGQAVDAVARRGLGHVPEGRYIFPELTVEENLRVGTFSRATKDGIDEDFAKVYDLFPDLAKRTRQEGWSLSGGQQQMLAVGRALMGRPHLLMLDEPSLGLAPLLVAEVLSTIREIKEAGTSVLLVEQNAAAALQIADRGYVLRGGTVTYEGAASELRTNEVVVSAYLGGRRLESNGNEIGDPGTGSPRYRN